MTRRPDAPTQEARPQRRAARSTRRGRDGATTPAPETRRCAVYTHKSTSVGLDQEFSSLDAQREACEQYVASQAHLGWRLVDDRYDDGGFTGANLERPGFQRLLADVDAGKIDVVVVYKVTASAGRCSTSPASWTDSTRRASRS